jgi:hypothetical protein
MLDSRKRTQKAQRKTLTPSLSHPMGEGWGEGLYSQPSTLNQKPIEL